MHQLQIKNEFTYNWLATVLANMQNCVSEYKPGPPRFARSTILEIKSPNFVKLALKKFGLAIKITATKETVPVVSRVPLSCRLYDRLMKA